MGYWRSFAEEHLLGSDRLVRNLYDLRQVDHLSERAIRIAVELNSDPLHRNIRLAVVVKDIAIKDAVQKISDLTPAGGARMQVFTDLAEAEAWLNRPMEEFHGLAGFDGWDAYHTRRVLHPSTFLRVGSCEVGCTFIYIRKFNVGYRPKEMENPTYVGQVSMKIPARNFFWIGFY